MNDLAKKLIALGFEPVYDAFAPLSSKEVSRLERKLGSKLPAEYRAFICEIGCLFFPGSVRVGRKKLPLGLIYGGGADRSRSLLGHFDRYIDRVPSSMLAIADAFGDQYLLGFKADDAGKVFYWEHHMEADPDDYTEQGLPVPAELMRSNITAVADSFAEFVGSINVDKDAEKKPSPRGSPKPFSPRLPKKRTARKRADNGTGPTGRSNTPRRPKLR